MDQLGILNGRNILYQKLDWPLKWDNLPNANWLALVILSKNNDAIVADISTQLIEHNCCYVCCTGESADLLHETIDTDLVLREIENRYIPPFEVVMTTSNADLEQEFWFSIYSAENDPVNIDIIICLDVSEGGKETELEALIKAFKNGYLPPI